MRKHESDNRPQNLAWSKLATITTFDRGKTESRKWKKGNALVLSKGTQATLSILVESLIDQLCKLTEKDPVTQKILYTLICKKLCKMKLIDKTYKIEEYQFMRTHYQRALQKLLSISCSPAIETKLETFLNQSPTALSLAPSVTSIYGWSRYESDFKEINFIANGGFGQVFRVRNRVDGREYAVKKIFLRYENENNFLDSLREVKTLASLDHPNIVAYKAAWFEPLYNVDVEAGSSSGSSSPKVSHGMQTNKSDFSVSEEERKTIDLEETSSNIVFEEVEEIAKMQESNPIHHKSSINNEIFSEPKIHELNSKERITTISKNCSRKISKFSKKNEISCLQDSKSSHEAYKERKLLRCQRTYENAVLYIQMQLYKESLREWLDTRNEKLNKLKLENSKIFASEAESDKQTEPRQNYPLNLDGESLYNALHIFLKILDGVDYIHAKNIIHHDLKPSNIFVESFEYCSRDEVSKGAQKFEKSEDGLRHLEKNRCSQVRVGDFGLACQISHKMGSDVESRESGDKKLIVLPADLVDKMKSHMKIGGHAQGEEIEVFGTKMYAAPEQLKGHCNIQSDVYSLGIILFELLLPFYTAMERNKTLSALRSGTIPISFELQYPRLVHLVRNMLSDNPDQRPSVKNLIKSINIYMKELWNDPYDFQREMMKNETSASKDKPLSQETNIEHFFSHSHHESRTSELLGIHNDIWNETSGGANSSKSACENPSCFSIRRELEETISRLKEENLGKDELILQLRQEIYELQREKKLSITEANT